MDACFLIFGFGYTAQVLAAKLLSKGFRVIGTRRKRDEQNASEPVGIKLIDFNCLDMEDYLEQSTHLLLSVPPSSHSMADPVLRQYGDLIKKHAKHLQWLGYLSSTGVYGDHQGRWVDEETSCNPHSPTGIARLNAEQSWLSYAQKHHLPLHVFRLSGIYGSGRNAIESICSGKENSLFKQGQVFCRIHVEDIVSVLLASMNSINPLSIYNLSDDVPEASHVVDDYVISLLKKDPLPLIPISEMCLSPMMQEFYSNNRRVSNSKIKKELNINLQYPSFREGLAHIWQEDFAQKKME